MSKQIYIDSNGNEVLVSGTITNDNNLPHFSGTPTQGSTAEAIASKVNIADNPSCKVTLNSNNPIKIASPINTGYCSFLIYGFVADLGAVMIAIQVTGNSIVSKKNLFSLGDFSSTHLQFAFSSGKMTLSSDSANDSTLICIGGYVTT